MYARFFSWLFAIACSLLIVVLPTELASAQDSKHKSKREDASAWVKDLEPGIRLYGHEPEFAEVGQSQQFDVAPDGQTIAFAVGNEIKFWNIEKRKVERKLDLKSSANTMEYLPDGRTMLATVWTTGEDGAPKQLVFVLDAITGEKRSEFSPTSVVDAPPLKDGETATAPVRHIQHIAIAPDEDWVALGFGQTTQVHEISTGEKISDISHSRPVRSIAFSSDSKQIYDGQGKVFDTKTGAEIEKMPPVFARKYLSSIRVHPKQDIIAAASWNSGLIVWDLAKKERVKLEQPKENAKQLYYVEFSNNGRYVASASYTPNGQSKLYAWELDSGELINSFKLPGQYISRMRFSADSNSIYTKVNGEYGVSHWELDSDPSADQERLFGNSLPISDFCFFDDDKSIVASSKQGNVVLYDLKNGQPQANLQLQQNVHLDATSNCRYFVSGAIYRSVSIYNCEQKKSQELSVRSFTQPSPIARLGRLLTGESENNYENFAINNIVAADDNEHFFVACRGRQNFRWEKFQLKSGKSVGQNQFKMKDYWIVGDAQQQNLMYWQVRSMAIAPNGQWLAIINHANNLFVIDAESGVQLHDLGDAGGQSAKIHFTPDSSRMLVAAGDTVRLWDVESGEEVEVDFKVGSPIQQIAVSRDGEWLALLGSGTSKLRVFDLENQDEVHSRDLKEAYVAVGISNDGRQIALAKSNCQFEVLDLEKVGDR